MLLYCSVVCWSSLWSSNLCFSAQLFTCSQFWVAISVEVKQVLRKIKHICTVLAPSLNTMLLSSIGYQESRVFRIHLSRSWHQLNNLQVLRLQSAGWSNSRWFYVFWKMVVSENHVVKTVKSVVWITYCKTFWPCEKNIACIKFCSRYKLFVTAKFELD